MTEDPKLLERARSLDRQGDTDEAVALLVRAGNLEEAARMLAGRARHLDAGKLLVTGLGETTADGRLTPRAADRARLAAAYFQKAGEVQRAADLLVSVGELPKAIDLLERAGKLDAAQALRKTASAAPASALPRSAGAAAPSSPAIAHPSPAAPSLSGTAAQAQQLEETGELEAAMKLYFGLQRFADAARLARKLGRNNDAANYYFSAQMFYEAAGCYFAVGDRPRSLESLARVPKEHPQYRAAAIAAARLVAETNQIGFRLETFLFPFTSSTPGDAAELEAFYLLARAYQQNDLPAPAIELYRKILEHSPNFRDAAARLAALDIVGDRQSLEKIMDEEAAFRGSAKRKAEEPAAAAPKKKGFPFKRAEQPPRAGAPAPAAPRGEAPPRVAADRALTIERATDGGAPQQLGAVRTEAGVNVGSVVAGRYRIDAPIGAGGMAVVFRATDLDIGESVALKIFTDLADERSVSRVKHELKISRQLTHPNIIRIYDLGIEEGHRYITMELLVGDDLWQYSQKQVLSVGQKLALLEQVCAGLHEAHSRGVVHRDIKPENLFVTSEGVVKVMDFGLAKGTDRSNTLSRTGMIAGTPEYMSPEQINDFSSVTPASDLYAVGIVAYKLFTGVVPFANPNLMPLLKMHTDDTPVPPRERNAFIPPELDAAILRLLAKSPAARPPSAAVLAEELRAIRQRHTLSGAERK